MVNIHMKEYQCDVRLKHYTVSIIKRHGRVLALKCARQTVYLYASRLRT